MGKYPHEITIVRHLLENHEDKYKVFHEKEILWYGSTGIQVQDGYIKNNSINILIPKAGVDIQKGDVIGLGNLDVSNFKEIRKYKNVITVTSVYPYEVGSDLDCTLITGE